MTDPKDPRPTNPEASPIDESSAGSSFNLRTLVREVADNSTLTDPGAIADEVFRRIPSEHTLAALRDTLRGYVKEFVRVDRMVDGAGLAHESAAKGGKPSSRSWKRDGVREAFRKALRDRIHVGPNPTEWKFLGDCTYDDLMFAAEERRVAAERTLSRAAHFEGLAGLLKAHGVEQVRDLPDDALSTHLDAGEAA